MSNRQDITVRLGQPWQILGVVRDHQGDVLANVENVYLIMTFAGVVAVMKSTTVIDTIEGSYRFNVTEAEQAAFQPGTGEYEIYATLAGGMVSFQNDGRVVIEDSLRAQHGDPQ